MPTITLKKGTQWSLGEKFDGGGFGTIHEATGEADRRVVIKLIRESVLGERYPIAVREAELQERVSSPGVMRILDFGEIELNPGDKALAIVMPLAEGSLFDRIQSGPIALDDVLGILVDVAEGLVALEGSVVHRDLKPANILHLDGHWCISDFGIARAADAPTSFSSLTWMGANTAQYASPEVQYGLPADHKADVYSFGVLAYELVAGRRPFPGPSREELKEQHKSEKPPPLSNCPPALATLIAECLRKGPGARPTATEVLRRLALDETPGEATVLAMTKPAMTDPSRLVRWRFDTAWDSLHDIARSLRRGVLIQHPDAVEHLGESEWSWVDESQAGATLRVSRPQEIGKYAWLGGDPPPFDVFAWTSIDIATPNRTNGYEGRGHALLYCDAAEAGDFRWFETAFDWPDRITNHGEKWTSPRARAPESWMGTLLRRKHDEQFMATVTPFNSADALGSINAGYRVVWPFTPVDGDSAKPFVDRWLKWFADATIDRLKPPIALPESEVDGTWRLDA